MTEKLPSDDARRLLSKLRQAAPNAGTCELLRNRDSDTSPPTNELYTVSSSGKRRTIASGVDDSQLAELSAAGLLSISSATVELTERGRSVSLEDIEEQASIPEQTLIYQRRSFWVGVAAVAVAALFGVLALQNDDGAQEEVAEDVPEPEPAPAAVSIGQAIRIDLQTNPDEIRRPQPVGADYLTTVPIQDVPEPPDGLNSCVGRYEWAEQFDPTFADRTNLEVQLTNTTDADIRITNIDVVIDENRSPPVATLLTCAGGGGPTPLRSVDVDLDNEQLVVRSEGEVIPADFVLAPTQFEVFDVTALSASCHCFWHLEFEVLRDGERETLVVDNNGTPFETASSINAKWYQFINRQWVDISIGAAEPPPPDIEIPEEAGDTCRHLPPDLVAQVAGDGWELAAGSGERVGVSYGLAGAPMVTEDCTYIPTGGEGFATALQLLRFEDAEIASSEAMAFADQMAFQVELVAVPTDLKSTVLVGGGDGSSQALVTCGASLLIVQAPDPVDLTDLIVPAARSVDPEC